MRTLGNIIWHFPFFGFISAILVYFFGLLLTLTIIAAPVGLGLMELGKLLFAPFGKVMIDSKDINLPKSKFWATYSTLIKILYLPFGLILALFAAIQVGLLFLTIVGIPVAIVVGKSLSTYLNPVGKKCVSSAVAAELERRGAEQYVTSIVESHLAETKPTSYQQFTNKALVITIIIGFIVLTGVLMPSLKPHLESTPADTPKSTEKVVVPEVIINTPKNTPIVIQSQDDAPAPSTKEGLNESSIDAATAIVKNGTEVKQKKKAILKVSKSHIKNTSKVNSTEGIQSNINQVDNEQHDVIQPSTSTSEQSKSHGGLRGLVEQATGLDIGNGVTKHQCTISETSMHANGC